MPTIVDANAAASPTRHTASIGNCVELHKDSRTGAPNSKGGVWYIDQLNANGTFDIRYVLRNQGGKNVRPQRIPLLNPLALTARRSSSSAVERPFILCPSHRPDPETSAANAASARLNLIASTVPPALPVPLESPSQCSVLRSNLFERSDL